MGATYAVASEAKMLILTRRVRESLIVGQDITVTVLAVNGHQVRLGVDAPKSVPVHREEIYDQIKAEKRGEERPAP